MLQKFVIVFLVILGLVVSAYLWIFLDIGKTNTQDPSSPVPPGSSAVPAAPLDGASGNKQFNF
jgi:hypothetical protein